MPVSANAASQPPTKLGLYPGETITVSLLIRGMIIKSANDAAMVMGEALGGSVEGFAQKMNAKAQALGMTRTLFRNPNGLPDPNQHTTARDLSRLAAALYRDFPQYYPLFSETRFTFHGRIYLTHNRFVLNYPGADGLKTGYIRASGFNLAASASRNGRRVIGVVLAAARHPPMPRWSLDQGFGTPTPAVQQRSAAGQRPALPASPTTASDGGTEDDPRGRHGLADDECDAIRPTTAATAVPPATKPTVGGSAAPAPEGPRSKCRFSTLVARRLRPPAGARRSPGASPGDDQATKQVVLAPRPQGRWRRCWPGVARAPPPGRYPGCRADGGANGSGASRSAPAAAQTRPPSRDQGARQAACRQPADAVAVDERGRNGKVYRARPYFAQTEANNAWPTLRPTSSPAWWFSRTWRWRRRASGQRRTASID